MAIGVGFDENGNPVDNGGYDENGAPLPTNGASFTPSSDWLAGSAGQSSLNQPLGQAQAVFDQAQSGATSPAPAPAAGAPEFGQGSANQPDPTQMATPASGQTADTPGEGHSWGVPAPMDADGGMKSLLANMFAQDPTAPGGQYSGGQGRRANPLRESNVGKQLMSAARGNTAYGNTGGKESLIGGGLKPQNFGQDEATATTEEPSDLLLQMLQLLNQPQQ